MNRRALISKLPALLVPVLIGGCSLLPDRPNVPVRRYALQPRRPFTQPAPARGKVLQVRLVRGVPGLQDIGLRRVRPDGSYEILPYEEWIAPPASLADAALRAWLQASGLYAAVVPQGSRAEADLVLEMQLTRLEAVPSAGEARAGMAGVLLRERSLASAVVRTLDVAAVAPLSAQAEAPEMAAAMATALGLAFARLEAELAPVAS